MQLHFKEKVPPYCLCVCVWEIMTLTLAKCNLSRKPPDHRAYQTYRTVWLSNFPNCLKPELRNHIAKNIQVGDKLVTNL